MTPQDHYTEAERLLEIASHSRVSDPANNRVAAAQAHATLALAGITALTSRHETYHLHGPWNGPDRGDVTP